MKLPVTYELDNFNLCAVLIQRLESGRKEKLKIALIVINRRHYITCTVGKEQRSTLVSRLVSVQVDIPVSEHCCTVPVELVHSSHGEHSHRPV